MLLRAVVGVNHVTGSAAAAAIIAGLVIGAGQRKQRIEQACFLQAEKYGISAQKCAKAALAELVVGPAGLVLAIWIADFTFFFSAAFENPQDVFGLRNFPAFQRRQLRDDAFRARLLGRGRGYGADRLRQAVGGIALAEARVLQRERTVVVERRAPQHSTVRHHAGFYF